MLKSLLKLKLKNTLYSIIEQFLYSLYKLTRHFKFELIFNFYPIPGLCELIGSPPSIWVDRNWRVDSTAPVGTVVARVRVSDVSNETLLQYGLEHSSGFNIVQENEEPLPFTIDENGKVTTNTSLTNKVNIIIKSFNTPAYYYKT